eukprot:TRINITY_DN21604_c0_g1_i1.p1 TRINITY_DN21604_c0_g1~~TRINITY_DN21604_c0_g1_i1.p1  ORF type:complete len:272 (+),score=73.61 TRINITY_DN21604_c0_g1_i1:124-939(+)
MGCGRGRRRSGGRAAVQSRCCSSEAVLHCGAAPCSCRRFLTALRTRLAESFTSEQSRPLPLRRSRAAVWSKLLGSRIARDLYAVCCDPDAAAPTEESAHGVNVRESGVDGAGRGVWYDGPETIPEGGFVTLYGGCEVPVEAVKDGSAGDYGVVVSDGGSSTAFVGNPSSEAAGVGHIVNDAAAVTGPSPEEAAQQLREYGKRDRNVGLALQGGRCAVVAIRPINPGSELFLEYGAEFWLRRLRSIATAAQDVDMLCFAEKALQEREAVRQL